MRPCDCKDRFDEGQLSVSGLRYLNDEIEIDSDSCDLCIVKLTIGSCGSCGSCTLKISQKVFKTLATWYMKDQKGIFGLTDITDNKNEKEE